MAVIISSAVLALVGIIFAVAAGSADITSKNGKERNQCRLLLFCAALCIFTAIFLAHSAGEA